MKKGLLFLAVTAVIVLGSFRYIPDWVKYTSPEGKYTISFPGKPIESVENDTNTDKTIFQLHMAAYEVSDSEVYMSSYIDAHTFFPADKSLKQILEDSRDGAANSLNATNVVTTATNLGENPFIEFLFTSAEFKGKDRIYVINKFQYSVLMIVSLNKDLTNADKFITSFKHM
jgi:hypothetical protein